MHSQKIRVATYGTLKRNHSNHGFLAGQRLLGDFKCDVITLFDFGPFPGAILAESEGVRVEVYEVSEETLGKLDELESFDAESPQTGLYNRVELETPFGLAWVYIYNHNVSGYPEIRSGEWFPCRS